MIPDGDKYARQVWALVFPFLGQCYILTITRVTELAT